MMRNASAEARELEALASDDADFWPLTPITPDESIWAAWELHRPHHDDGVVMFFRRSRAPSSSFAVPWVGLDPHSWYSLEYRMSYGIDKVEPNVSGSTMTRNGLRVHLPATSSSLLIRFSPAKTDDNYTLVFRGGHNHTVGRRFDFTSEVASAKYHQPCRVRCSSRQRSSMRRCLT